MPITKDAAVTGSATAAASLTIADVEVGDARNGLLLVAIGATSSQVDSVCWGDRFFYRIRGASNTVRGELWAMTGLPAGTRDLTIRTVAATNIAAAAICFYGVDQDWPWISIHQAQGIGTDAEIDVDLARGVPIEETMIADVLVCADNLLSDRTVDPDEDQDEAFDLTVNPGETGAIVAGSTRFAADAGQPMLWTISSSADWVQVGVSLKPFEYSLLAKISAGRVF